jgi:hypothetical protein
MFVEVFEPTPQSMRRLAIAMLRSLAEEQEHDQNLAETLDAIANLIAAAEE